MSRPALTQSIPAPPPSSNTWKYVAGVVVLILVAAGYFIFARQQQPAPIATTQTAAPAITASATTQPTNQVQPAAVPNSAPASSSTGTVNHPAAADSPVQEIPNKFLRKAERRQKIRETLKERVQEEAAQPATGGGMWTRDDIPDLLRKADAYSGKGEYGRAMATYKEVLRIDPSNLSARDGLQRAREAAQIRRQ
jgi:hypothetical protein